jgi:hypothetical protein
MIAVVPLSHQICRTLSLLAKAIISWNHLRKKMDEFALESEHWIGRAFCVLLCGWTVIMIVEYYETLLETLLWQSLKHGKREDDFPGIRKIKLAIMPLMD